MTAFFIVVGVGVAIAILIYCMFILLGSLDAKQKRAAEQALLSETGGDSFVDLYNNADTDEEKEEIVLFALKSGYYKNTQQVNSEEINTLEEETPLPEAGAEEYLEDDIEEDASDDIGEEEYIEEVIEEHIEEIYGEEELIEDVYVEESFVEEEYMEQTIVGMKNPFISPHTKEKELQIFDFSNNKNNLENEE